MKNIPTIIIIAFISYLIACSNNHSNTPDKKITENITEQSANKPEKDTVSITNHNNTSSAESEKLQPTLKGTSALPNTRKQIQAREYGIHLNKVTKAKCDENRLTGEISMEEGIDKIRQTDSTITIEISIIDNCCFDFICDIEVNKSATLNLLYEGYGEFCMCNCLHKLKYQFWKDKAEYGNKSIKSVMINNNLKTIRKL